MTSPKTVIADLQNENDNLRQQLADSEAERLEQARLLGMSGEREAGLQGRFDKDQCRIKAQAKMISDKDAEIERLKSEHATAYKLVDYWQKKASALPSVTLDDIK